MTEPPGCLNSGHPGQGEPKPLEPSVNERDRLLAELAALRAREYHLLEEQVRAKAALRVSGRSMPSFKVTGREDLRLVLNESRSRMEYVAQCSFIPVYKVNKGLISFANDAAAHLLGYPLEELRSGSFPESRLVPRDRVTLEQKASEHLVENLGSHVFETERIAENGRKIPVACTFRLVDVDSGERLVYLLDLSEIRHLEEHLKQRQTIFSALVSEMPNIIFVVSADGRSRQFNNRFYELTGINPADDDGFLWRQYVPEDDLSGFDSAFLQSVRKDSPLVGEFRIRSKDGDEYWHIVRVMPVKNPLPGQLQGLLELTVVNGAAADNWSESKGIWIGTATDINKRKQLMEDVLESAHAFQFLADQIPQIVWTAGPDGRIDFFSQRWFDFSGLSRQYKVGLDFALFMHPDDRREYINRWKSCVKSGDAFEAELRLKGSGEYVRFLARAVALRNERGEVVQWVGTWTSID